MSTKVDSAAVQDGFGIYRHSFFFTHEGQWCVVQQGMDEKSGWARRYHWLAESVEDFVCEPHAAVEDLADRPAEAASQAPDGQRQGNVTRVPRSQERSRADFALAEHVGSALGHAPGAALAPPRIYHSLIRA